MESEYSKSRDSRQDLQTKQPIAAGSVVELKDGVQIRLDDERSRMIHVQMVNK